MGFFTVSRQLSPRQAVSPIPLIAMAFSTPHFRTAASRLFKGVAGSRPDPAWGTVGLTAIPKGLHASVFYVVSSCPSRGSVMVKVLPWPTTLWTVM